MTFGSTYISNSLGTMNETGKNPNQIISDAANANNEQNSLLEALGMNVPGNSGSSTSGTSSSSTDSSNLLNTQDALNYAQSAMGLQDNQLQFEFGLQQQGEDADTGRTMKINTQQDAFQTGLNQQTQDALTQRQQMQDQTQEDLNNANINQSNYATQRAIGLASKPLGS